MTMSSPATVSSPVGSSSVRSKSFIFSIASSVPDIASIDGLSDLTALRVVRVLRLIKLVRVLRGSRLFKRWEIRFAIDYAMLELTKTFCMLLMVSAAENKAPAKPRIPPLRAPGLSRGRVINLSEALALPLRLARRALLSSC